jgi:hypothetical protein
MERNEAEKASTVGKTFMAVGPTLHYSHPNVQIFWFLAVVVFGMSCLLWSKLTAGTFASFDPQQILSLDTWRLDRFVTSGVSIFEYPWQILVLGLLMGVLAVGPILIAQLLSFPHSIPFILAVLLLANLPGLAASLVLSCVGVACRPLRFRSRIIAIALCMAPQVVYWGLFGSERGTEPVLWGVSFAPWVAAWLVGLAVSGIVLAIGHYTRYKPGIVVSVLAGVWVLTIVVFESTIGLNELAYQLHVVRNDPDRTPEFRDHLITKPLDRTITDPAVRKYLAGYFYPTEPIPLREVLKKECQEQLRSEHWPGWFRVPKELNYQEKRQWLDEQYDLFIYPVRPWWMPQFVYQRILDRRTSGHRMAVALYYKALLGEYTPDLVMLGREEVLHFYHDYPQDRSREIWYQLYSNFSVSPESMEARWRIARRLAGKPNFELAWSLAGEARGLVREQLNRKAPQDVPSDLRRLFHPPAASVMTENRLKELQGRLDRLCSLIGRENRAGSEKSETRLAEFVMLNPHSLEYPAALAALLTGMPEDDPLRDNVLLAQALTLADAQACAEKLAEVHRRYPQTDGGKEALYELARLKIRLYQSETGTPSRKALLAEARSTLNQIMTQYPGHFLAEEAKQNLQTLPTE